MYYLVVHVDINGEGGWVGGESMAQWRNLWLVAQMLCQDAFYKEYVCSACAGGFVLLHVLALSQLGGL